MAIFAGPSRNCAVLRLNRPAKLSPGLDWPFSPPGEDPPRSYVLSLLMGRRPRFLPEDEDGVLVEITCRAIGGRALLTPAPNPRRFNEVVVGVLGRALEVSPLELCGLVVLGTHLHALAVVHDQQSLSRFMHHVGCNLSKEVGGRIRQWRGSFWERRYDGIVVSDEPGEQWKRLKYLMSNSVVMQERLDAAMDFCGVAESMVGKSLGTDLEQQKPTLPVIYALKSAGPAERREIDIADVGFHSTLQNEHEGVAISLQYVTKGRIRAAVFAET